MRSFASSRKRPLLNRLAKRSKQQLRVLESLLPTSFGSRLAAFHNPQKNLPHLHLIEAIDPLCLVVTEQASARILSLAYNQPIKLDCCDGVLGRPCCAFVDFERMLQTDERKQRAWALLKEMLTRVNAH